VIGGAVAIMKSVAKHGAGSLCPFGERVGVRGSPIFRKIETPHPTPLPMGEGADLPCAGTSDRSHGGVLYPLTLIAALVAGIASAAAQDYPTRQISLIAPFAAGGSTDLVARVLSEGMRQRLGQPVVVENKPGATGLIGDREVAKAPADGYTLLLGNAGALVIPAAMNANFPLDLIRDFTPISVAAEFAGVMLVRKGLPATLPQFIAYAKNRGGSLNFGSSGVGSSVHLAAELLMKETGIKMQHVPYKGGANSMTDLIAGTLDVLFVSSPVAVAQASNKEIQFVAVTSRYRLQELPNVPTMEQTGLPGFDVTSWMGVLGPARLPDGIRGRLSSVLVEIAKEPATQARLRAIGFEPIGMDADEFDRFYRADIKRWTGFVKERGLKDGP
jgi:tripartite-type tricarboxylate transporter receptor subunit TctC